MFQERTPDYQHFSQWGKDVPSYQELIDIRDRMLARHPKTIFIACHLGNQGNDLATLEQGTRQVPEPLPGHFGARLRGGTGTAGGGQVPDQVPQPGDVRHRHGPREEHVPVLVAAV